MELTREQALAWLTLEGWEYRDEEQLGCEGIVCPARNCGVLLCADEGKPRVHNAAVNATIMDAPARILPGHLMVCLPLAIEYIRENFYDPHS